MARLNHTIKVRTPAGYDELMPRTTPEQAGAAPAGHVHSSELHGVTNTAAATAAKICGIPGFVRVAGIRISVLFELGNTAATPTLNVNATGAGQIWHNGAVITSASPNQMIPPMHTADLLWDGTRWQLMNPAVNRSIPSGTCTTAVGTAAKAVTISGFAAAQRVTGRLIEVLMTVGNSSTAATLNVSSTGAGGIRHDGSVPVLDKLRAMHRALYVWDGSFWQLLNPSDRSAAKASSNSVFLSDAAQGLLFGGQTPGRTVDDALQKLDGKSGPDVPQNTLRGRASSGVGAVENLTPQEAADVMMAGTIAAKSAPVAADTLLLSDNSQGNRARRATLASLKNAIETTGDVVTSIISPNPLIMPTGYLPADGRIVTQSEHPALYSRLPLLPIGNWNPRYVIPAPENTFLSGYWFDGTRHLFMIRERWNPSNDAQNSGNLGIYYSANANINSTYTRRNIRAYSSTNLNAAAPAAGPIANDVQPRSAIAFGAGRYVTAHHAREGTTRRLRVQYSTTLTGTFTQVELPTFTVTANDQINDISLMWTGSFFVLQSMSDTANSARRSYRSADGITWTEMTWGTNMAFNTMFMSNNGRLFRYDSRTTTAQTFVANTSPPTTDTHWTAIPGPAFMNAVVWNPVYSMYIAFGWNQTGGATQITMFDENFNSISPHGVITMGANLQTRMATVTQNGFTWASGHNSCYFCAGDPREPSNWKFGTEPSNAVSVILDMVPAGSRHLAFRQDGENMLRIVNEGTSVGSNSLTSAAIYTRALPTNELGLVSLIRAA